MTPIALAALRVLSATCGLMMVALTAIQAHGYALIAAALAAIAVGAGIAFRPAATLAVLLAASVIALSDPSSVFGVLAGVAAVAYLVTRHAPGVSAALAGPTTIGALGFAAAGLTATLFPLRLPWLPLLAPLVVFAIFAVALRPFFVAGNRPGN